MNQALTAVFQLSRSFVKQMIAEHLRRLNPALQTLSLVDRFEVGFSNSRPRAICLSDARLACPNALTLLRRAFQGS
jgi:hypothetical protein